MNKSQFFRQMIASLGDIPEADRSEILYDYEEHFAIGLSYGKTEEEVAESLGDPNVIVKQYLQDSKKYNHPVKKTILEQVLSGVLMFLNVVLAYPLIGCAFITLGLFYFTAVLLFGSGIFAVVVILIYPLLDEWLIILGSPFVIIPGGIGLASLGIVCFLGLLTLHEKLSCGLKKYFTWYKGLLMGRGM